MNLVHGAAIFRPVQIPEVCSALFYDTADVSWRMMAWIRQGEVSVDYPRAEKTFDSLPHEQSLMDAERNALILSVVDTYLRGCGSGSA